MWKSLPVRHPWLDSFDHEYHPIAGSCLLHYQKDLYIRKFLATWVKSKRTEGCVPVPDGCVPISNEQYYIADEAEVVERSLSIVDVEDNSGLPLHVPAL